MFEVRIWDILTASHFLAVINYTCFLDHLLHLFLKASLMKDLIEPKFLCEYKNA